MFMLHLLSPLFNIRDHAAMRIRELVYSLVNKEDGAIPVHPSSVSALRPCFPSHFVAIKVFTALYMMEEHEKKLKSSSSGMVSGKVQ